MPVVIERYLISAPSLELLTRQIPVVSPNLINTSEEAEGRLLPELLALGELTASMVAFSFLTERNCVPSTERSLGVRRPQACKPEIQICPLSDLDRLG